MNTTETSNELETLWPANLIDRILKDHSGHACITCSFQIEDIVVLHLLRTRLPDIAVLFLDTGYHFAETYAYRDYLAQSWKLNLINVVPKKTVAEQESECGHLYGTDPGRCCYLRKVEPLMEALQSFQIWFTGLRREQSPTRRNLKVIEQHELPGALSILKVSPLAAWNWEQVWGYAAREKLECLPLYVAGYRSIGCEPCTSIPREGADPRTGRWGGTKLECGIHTFSRRTEK